jgi:hypothetical protein
VTLWLAITISSAAVFSWKILGYLVPEKYVGNSKVQSLATLLTVSLLASLVGIQSFVGNQGIELDARVPALLVAGLLFYLRAPFLVAVGMAALVAALVRLVF